MITTKLAKDLVPGDVIVKGSDKGLEAFLVYSLRFGLYSVRVVLGDYSKSKERLSNV